MKVAGLRKLEAETTPAFPAEIPEDLRRALASTVGRHIAEALEAKGVSEEEILEDFDAFRLRRR